MKNILSKLSGFSGFFLLVLSMSNFYLAFRASRVVNLKSVTVTNVVEVVNLKSSTNDFPSAASLLIFLLRRSQLLRLYLFLRRLHSGLTATFWLIVGSALRHLGVITMRVPLLLRSHLANLSR